MTSPLEPGVFVNVIQTPLSGAVGIPGEGTAAFCLPYNIGPTIPVLISSFSQFVNLFGSFAQSNGSLLHHAVFQYFNNGGTSCFVARVPNTDAVGASLTLKDIGLTAPAAPVPTTATSGGTVAAGTYKVVVSYVSTSGETVGSAQGTVVTTGSTSTITVPSPPALANATGWYAYVSQAGGNTLTRQQTLGSPTAIGTNLTLTAPPTSSGANPLGTSTAVDSILTIKANSVGAWGNNVFVAITNANGNSASGPRFNLVVYSGGTTPGNIVETFPSVSVNPADSRYVASVVNSPFAGSNYINVSVTLPGAYVQGVYDPAFVSATTLNSGSDGVAVPSSSSSPTLATSVQNAFNTLQDQVLWLNLPGLTIASAAWASGSNYSSGATVSYGGLTYSALHALTNDTLPPPSDPTNWATATPQVDVATINSLLTWADGRTDVMLIIDGPTPNLPEVSSGVVSNYTSLVSGGTPINADANAVVYAPWLYVLDPASSVQGSMRFVPPGAAALAMWDRAVIRYGIQQAPAGTWTTLKTQALEVAFTDADIISLTAAQVNPIIRVPNVGYCIWGARTLATGLPSRYVNVQRSIIQITHDLENILSQFTFQPNNSDLWDRITGALNTYLMTQMQTGVLAGNTPASAYQVLCDSTLNTPTSAQSGYVYANVGVALTSPAEFIVITLQLLSGSTAVTSS